MKKVVNLSIIGIFVALYLITSIISTIHSIDFFALSNSREMSIFLAIAFEIGAAASLASIVVYNKMHKGLIWSLFIILTLFQVMNNVYYTYVNLHDYTAWIELFGLQDMTRVEQMRILSIVAGATLPLVALGFIKSLVDYLKPDEIEDKVEDIQDDPIEETKEELIETPKNENEESLLSKIRMGGM